MQDICKSIWIINGPPVTNPIKTPSFCGPKSLCPEGMARSNVGRTSLTTSRASMAKATCNGPNGRVLVTITSPPKKNKKTQQKHAKTKTTRTRVCVCVCVCYWKGYIPPGHPLILIYFRRKLWSKSFSKPRRSELADCPIWEVGQRVQLLSTDKKRRSKWQNQTQWFDVPTIKNNESLCHGMVWIFLLSSAHMQKQHHVYYIHIIWDKFRPLKKKTLWFGVFRPVSGVLFEPAAAWTHGSRIKWPELYTPEN